mmetsp:Transcript_73205/g.211855  ORF Transcript_73205/g.211855 Transcript_73205/m.211855 type:complete len:202 (-) Transcript_73205:1042-1647(-)
MHLPADQDVGRHAGGEDGHVHEQEEVQQHRRGRADGVGLREVPAREAVLVEELGVPTCIRLTDAVQDRLKAQHAEQQDHQREARGILPTREVGRHTTSPHRNEVSFAEAPDDALRVVIDPVAHAARVDEHAADEVADPHGRVIVVPRQVVQDRLRGDEHGQREQEPQPSEQERAERHLPPEHVRDDGHRRVAHQRRVLVLD